MLGKPERLAAASSRWRHSPTVADYAITGVSGQENVLFLFRWSELRWIPGRASHSSYAANSGLDRGEMTVRIAGRQFCLWRAVGDEGEVLDLPVQRRPRPCHTNDGAPPFDGPIASRASA